MQFNTGAIRTIEDPQDFKFESQIGMAGEPFDWDKGFNVEDKLSKKINTKDQNGSFSCGGQAGAYYAEVLHAIHDKEQTEKSAKFIYAPIFQGNGGSAIKDIMDRLIKVGAADESLCPSYENGNPPSEPFMQRKQDITEQAIKNALTDKASVYAFVNRDIDAIARAIRDNNGIIIGITGQDNGTWHSAFPKSPTLGGNYWNHWVYGYTAKLINGKKYIGFKNSWGNIGENGTQYISEEWLQWLWGLTTAVVLPEPTTTFKFTKDLWLGFTDNEVKELQKYLNNNGFPVSQRGAGSKGNETNYFGALTKNALVRFQKANRISPAVGYFGKITRNFINK